MTPPAGPPEPGPAATGAAAPEPATTRPATPPRLALRDGTPLHVRPLGRADRDALAGAIARQSAPSRYARWFSGAPQLPEAVLNRLVEAVDQRDHVALVLVADLPDGPVEVAVGRLIRSPGEPDSAEVTFAVDDAWQGRGAGTALGRALVAAAEERGVHYLTAMVQTDNARSLALLAGLGQVRSRRIAEPGVYDVEVALDPPGEQVGDTQTAPN